MRQRTWISREEIAEIYDARADNAQQEFYKGETGLAEAIADASRISHIENQAQLMRDIDGLENKMNLESHTLNTKQANKYSRNSSNIRRLF